ncbi:hypothetical protein [Sphingomonas montanisoli]|uniref:Uncharacterized protein n=1 Tax=Sphingomonas montanisoli TaxID=2606412 RepID=A0A5D9C2Y4_9SPHN|nr:hypothetical protein [Sphingomonas montanisoli]TZG25627.1 hypothetical protein FYJ91_11415 [Sphingomonas montanisoli]
MSDAPNRYRVHSLLDLARVPEDALPRLMAELPALLTAMRPMALLIDAMKASGEDVTEAEAALVQSCEWIDDTKGELTINARVQTGDDRKEVARASVTLDIPTMLGPES